MDNIKPDFLGNNTLTTITRFHRRERLGFLEEAIFSLATQRWGDLEAIIVLQNATAEIRAEVTEIVQRQTWSISARYKILSIDIPEGHDGRSALLNLGIQHASGRYLAFLDDDDIVYPESYSILIQQLIEGGHAIAVGGCYVAKMKYEHGRWSPEARHKYTDLFMNGRSRLDLFLANFIPIHSYIIDRARVGSFDLHFDESFPPLEDYDFLLRLCAVFDPDFSRIDQAICEYRIREDGSNSIPYSEGASPEAIAAHERAQKLILERKKSLICSMPVSELAQTAKKLFLLENRVRELEAFIDRIRQNPCFKIYHWVKYLGHK